MEKQSTVSSFARCRQYNHRTTRIPIPSRYALAFECRDFDEVVTAREDFAISDTPPLTCRFTKWFRNGTFMATADEQGLVHLFDIEQPLQRGAEGAWEAHKNAIFDLAWMPVPGEARLLTASGDQKIQLWDCTKTRSPLMTFAGHTGSVKSVNFCYDEPMLFASGARDGHVMLWDLRVNRTGHRSQNGEREPYQVKPCSQLLNAHNSLGVAASNHETRQTSRRPRRHQSEIAGRQSVTAVMFKSLNCIVSAGGGDGIIKVWDVRKPHSVHHVVSTPVDSFSYCGQRPGQHGFTDLVMDPTKATVFASCTDNVIYQYDIASCCSKPVATFNGHGLDSYFVKMDISQDGEFLVTGSKTNDAIVYQAKHPYQPPVALSGHVGEVMGVAFCPSMQSQLVTCSDDCAVRVWRQKGATPLYGRGNGRAIGESRLLAAPPRRVTSEAATAKDSSTSPCQKTKRPTSMLQFVTRTPGGATPATAMTTSHREEKENENSEQPRHSPAAKRVCPPRAPLTPTTATLSVQVNANTDSCQMAAAAMPTATPLSPINLQQTMNSAAPGTHSVRTPTTPSCHTSAGQAVTPTPHAKTTLRHSPFGQGKRSSAPTTPKMTALQRWLSPSPKPSPGGLAAASLENAAYSGALQSGSHNDQGPQASACVRRRLSTTLASDPPLPSENGGGTASASQSCNQNVFLIPGQLSPGRKSPSPTHSPLGGLVAAAE